MRIREGREGRVFALAAYAGARRRARCWVKLLSESIRGFTLSFTCVAVSEGGGGVIGDVRYSGMLTALTTQLNSINLGMPSRVLDFGCWALGISGLGEMSRKRGLECKKQKAFCALK